MTLALLAALLMTQREVSLEAAVELPFWGDEIHNLASSGEVLVIGSRWPEEAGAGPKRIALTYTISGELRGERELSRDTLICGSTREGDLALFDSVRMDGKEVGWRILAASDRSILYETSVSRAPYYTPRLRGDTVIFLDAEGSLRWGACSGDLKGTLPLVSAADCLDYSHLDDRLYLIRRVSGKGKDIEVYDSQGTSRGSFELKWAEDKPIVMGFGNYFAAIGRGRVVFVAFEPSLPRQKDAAPDLGWMLKGEHITSERLVFLLFDVASGSTEIIAYFPVSQDGDLILGAKDPHRFVVSRDGTRLAALANGHLFVFRLPLPQIVLDSR